METHRPGGERPREYHDLAPLVEVIKSVWEGPEFCFIQRTAPNTINFNLTICNRYLPEAKQKIEAASEKIRQLGYTVFPEEYPHVSFSGKFDSAEIDRFADELELITKYHEADKALN